MQQSPIEVGDDHEKNWEFIRQFRDLHQHDKDISTDIFHMRDETDWQSILSPLERSERRNNQLMNRTFLQKNVNLGGYAGASSIAAEP